jgi:ABC-type transport system substrate-binding protein
LGCGSSEAIAPESDRAKGAAPRRGGVFRLLEEAPESLDPAEVDSVYDALPVGQIFDGLVALDAGLNIVPSLADAWTISRDGRVYKIHLREGIAFHDGTPLTSQDVVFSFKRVLDRARAGRSVAGSYLQVVEGAPEYIARRTEQLPGVVAIDTDQVEIRLTRPYLSFLAVLAMDDLRIVPEKVVRSVGEDAFRRHPVGTGPFRFASWTDTELRLDSCGRHFGQPVYLDQVVIVFPRPGERDGGNARFLRGELEIVKPNKDALSVLEADKRIEIHRYQDLSLNFMGMYTATPPLDDVRVRQAIASAIDRRALAELTPATRREAQGILPPGLPCYSPTPKALPYSPEAARALLASAGHPGGRGLPPIPLYTAQSGSSEVDRSNEQLKSDLAAVGITLEVHQVTWPELNDRITRHQAPLFQLGWVADLPDPDSFLRSLFEQGGSANYFEFRDDPTGSALTDGASETNPVERAHIYRGLEKGILDKAPLVPLFHSIGLIASRRTVHGLKPGPMGFGALALQGVWLEAEASVH